MYDEVVSISDAGFDDVYDIINYETLNDNIFEDEGHFVVDDLVIHNCIPEYVERRNDKKQSWKAGEHPDIAKELESTHGIICYQEQLQKIWQKFGGFTAPEAEAARKAVAKKWRDKLKGIEAKWKDGASKTIGQRWADIMWERMVTFGRYAFNKCLDKDTLLTDALTGDKYTIQDLVDNGFDNCYLWSELDGSLIYDKIIDIIDTGHQEVLEIELDNGIKQYVTEDHKFKCIDGEYRTVKQITEGDHSIMVQS